VEQGEELIRVPLHSIRIQNSDINLGKAAFSDILRLAWGNTLQKRERERERERENERERVRKDSRRVKEKVMGRREGHFINEGEKGNFIRRSPGNARST
jgi:hypothetical protein